MLQTFSAIHNNKIHDKKLPLLKIEKYIIYIILFNNKNQNFVIIFCLLILFHLYQ